MSNNSLKAAERLRKKILFQKKIYFFMSIFFVFILTGITVYFVFIKEYSKKEIIKKTKEITPTIEQKIKVEIKEKTAVLNNKKSSKKDRKVKKSREITNTPQKTKSKLEQKIEKELNLLPKTPVKVVKKKNIKQVSNEKVKTLDIKPLKKDSSYTISLLLNDLYFNKETKNIEKKPNYKNKKDYIEMALIYNKKGIKNKSIQLLKEGIEKFPDSGSILLLMATFLMETGKKDEAKKIIDKFGTSLLGEPLFLKKIIEYKDNKIDFFTNYYNIFKGELFYTIKVKEVYRDKQKISRLNWDNSEKKIIYHLDGVGEYLLSPKDFSKKLFSDSFSLSFSKKGYINLKYEGISNSRIKIECSPELNNLKELIEVEKQNLKEVSISPAGDFLATYKKNGVFSLIDTNSGMVRYSFNRAYTTGKNGVSFVFPIINRKSLKSRSLYYLFCRAKNILSISKLDLNRYEEKRIFSINTVSNKFQAIDVWPGKFALLSCLPENKINPSIYMMGYFGKNPVEIIKNGSYPILTGLNSGFYFLRDGKIYYGKLGAVKFDELIDFLNEITPKSALEIIEKIDKKNGDLKISKLKNKLIEKNREIEAGLLFYRGKLFEEMGYLKIAKKIYNKIINKYSLSTYFESANSSVEKIDIINEKRSEN